MAKNKYYVVWQGNTPGVYNSWAECQLQTKEYPGAKFKGFPTEAEAKQAFSQGYADFIKFGGSKAKPQTSLQDFKDEIVWDSISVDAACSGNPGKMEYQGVDTSTGYQFFHQQFERGTNNIGEFLAIVHALAQFKKEGKDTPIYTDSKIAMGWVARKKCSTKLKLDTSTQKLFQVIDRAEKWLKQHTFQNKILKWDTVRWGEIPADFGRK